MRESSELYYTCLAQYGKQTGFGESEPSGNYHSVIVYATYHK